MAESPNAAFSEEEVVNPNAFAEGRAAGGPSSLNAPPPRPDALLRPRRANARQRNVQALPPEVLKDLSPDERAFIESQLGSSGAASDRLALLEIPDTVASSPVLVRKGDATSLGTAPTIGRSAYQPPRTSTVVDTLEDFWDLGRAKLIDLQQRLWQGGFFGEGDPPAFGGDLTKTYSAYRDAVLLAARSGRSLMDEILDPEAEGAPLRKVTNREDIRVLLERVAPEEIGRALSDDEMERFVTRWHELEQEISSGEEPMSTEALVDVTLGEVAPGEEESFDFARRSLQFFDMLGSPV